MDVVRGEVVERVTDEESEEPEMPSLPSFGGTWRVGQLIDLFRAMRGGAHVST